MNTDQVSRVEIINHLEDKGREYVFWDDKAHITISLQDDGRTLKIFIEKKYEKV
jgi:hypothetical protein